MLLLLSPPNFFSQKGENERKKRQIIYQFNQTLIKETTIAKGYIREWNMTNVNLRVLVTDIDIA